jgi:hypothetical protein
MNDKQPFAPATRFSLSMSMPMSMHMRTLSAMCMRNRSSG